jgi:thiamine biosynthesis lipoprotein ApbE
MVVGPDEALRLAAEHGVEVLLIVRDGDRFVEYATAGFPNDGPQ